MRSTPNPFRVGSPVYGTSFFGRKHELEQILKFINRGSAVNVYSLRRIGKTSLKYQMAHLCREDPKWQNYSPFLLDGDIIRGGDINGLQRIIGWEIQHRLKIKHEISEWKSIRDTLRSATGQSLLLLDEAGCIANTSDTDSLGQLRALHQEGGVSFVFFTAYRQLRELLLSKETVRANDPPLSNLFLSVRLPAFTLDEARYLLMRQFELGGRKIDAALANAIAGYVGCYPQLVQEMGHIAFDFSVEKQLTFLDLDNFSSIRQIWLHRLEEWWEDIFLTAINVFSNTVRVTTDKEDIINTLLAYGLIQRVNSGELEPSQFIKDVSNKGYRGSLYVSLATLLDSVLKTAPTSKVQRLSTENRMRVFVSYSHRDKKWLSRLQVHLQPLVREGLIDLWDDTKLDAGTDWRKDIAKALENSSIAILLISADFLASDFIAHNELPTLLKVATEKGVCVVPVVVSPCLFESHEDLVSYQSINSPSRPLSKMKRSDSESFLVKLTETIIKYVK